MACHSTDSRTWSKQHLPRDFTLHLVCSKYPTTMSLRAFFCCPRLHIRSAFCPVFMKNLALRDFPNALKSHASFSSFWTAFLSPLPFSSFRPRPHSPPRDAFCATRDVPRPAVSLFLGAALRRCSRCSSHCCPRHRRCCCRFRCRPRVVRRFQRSRPRLRLDFCCLFRCCCRCPPRCQALCPHARFLYDRRCCHS